MLRQVNTDTFGIVLSPSSSHVCQVCSTHDDTLVVDATDSQEVSDTRTFLRNHESEISSLGVQLERIRTGVQDLHKQYRKTSETMETRSVETMKGTSRGLRSEKRS